MQQNDQHGEPFPFIEPLTNNIAAITETLQFIIESIDVSLPIVRHYLIVGVFITLSSIAKGSRQLLNCFFTSQQLPEADEEQDDEELSESINSSNVPS